MILDRITKLIEKYFILSLRSKRMILAFIIIFFVLTVIKTSKDKKVRQNFAIFLLLSYLLLILVSTVLARIDWKVWDVKGFDLEDINLSPFYSYSLIAAGYSNYQEEVIMNIFMLLPFGFLLPYSFKNRKMIFYMIICLSVSVGIEFFQLIYTCGLCEVDDVIHNTLGGMMGVFCFSVLCKLRSLYRNRYHKKSKKKKSQC